MASRRRTSALGTRLSEILSETSGYRPSAAGALYGEETAELLAEELETEIVEEELILPYPEYLRNIEQSRRGAKSTPRPDLYPEFYDAAGYGQSTRIWAMQWIPTAANGDLVIGDLLVVFARTTGVNGGRIFVYTDVPRGKWVDITEYSSSYGKAISGLSHYHVLDDPDKLRYQTLHAKTDEGTPWEDWIWDKEGVWAGGRPNNESATYIAIRAGYSRRAE